MSPEAWPPWREALLVLAVAMPTVTCRSAAHEPVAAALASAPSAGTGSPAPVNASIPAVADGGTAVDAFPEGAPSSPSSPSPPRVGAYANVDPADDLVVGPPEARPGCHEALARAGVTFTAASLPVHRARGSRITCGAPDVVTYVRGPGRIRYAPPPLLTCGMALALASFERVVQEEASRVMNARVTQIEQIGTYNCRSVVRFKDVVSEHAYANAIDLTRFVFEDGRSVSVLADFDLGAGPPVKPGGDFLRAISQRGEDEDVISNVLTPFWDAAHRNHFHLDLARYRVEGARPTGP